MRRKQVFFVKAFPRLPHRIVPAEHDVLDESLDVFAGTPVVMRVIGDSSDFPVVFQLPFLHEIHHRLFRVKILRAK